MSMNKTIFDINVESAGGHHIIDHDFDDSDFLSQFGIDIFRDKPFGLPCLPEVEVVRHFTNLSRENYGVDNGTYPLGSCTMKYNPKINDTLSSLDGFKYVHPFQPEDTMQGIWELFYNLQNHFCSITGMDAYSLQPAAGANGELAGLFIIKKYLKNIGEGHRNTILIADSAHGTNPASAAMAGFTCKIVPTNHQGLMDIEALTELCDDTVAALMLTNPSTLGLFDKRIEEIAATVHKNKSLLYYDGANLNALMGITRPGDMGFDVMHINTHKTFSTPHSGGGPGAGPIGVKSFLSQYLPIPVASKKNNTYYPEYNLSNTIGIIKSGYGHLDVLIKAYSYILTNGAEGLKETSENAVLNANYLQACLSDILPSVYSKFCMHECLLDGSNLGVSAYTFSKRLIDYGLHPPTLVGAGCVYFPQDLKNALLIEPTETETKINLDNLVSIFKKVVAEALEDKELVINAPHSKIVSQVPIDSEEV